MRLLVSALLFCAAAPAWSQELSYDFRGSKFDDQLFGYEGPNAQQYFAPEEQGLRLRFPPGQAPARPVGIFCRTPVRGDFMVTAEYEIVQRERPTQGKGVSIELYLMLDTPARDGIAFARTLPVKGDPAVTLLHLTDNAAGQRFAKVASSFPTTERSEKGFLRLAREGATLIASLAEAGPEKTVTELERADIGTADIRMVRFGGISGGDPNAPLDVRLVQFHLRTELTARPSPAAPSRSRWLFWALVTLVLLALAAWISIVWQRRSKPGEAAGPGTVAKLPPTQSAGEAVVVACPGCQKQVKVRPHVVGRRIKCPACAAAFVA